MEGKFSCPTAESGLVPEARVYSIVISGVYLVYIVLCVAVFAYYRHTSVFLRRRPLNFILITAAGALCGWAAVTLRMVVGNEAFPCWLTGLLYYSAPPLVKGTLVLKDARYLTEVNAIRMGRQLAMQRESSMRQSNASGLNLDAEGLDLVGSDASLETFSAHIRTIFRYNRKEEDRLKNLRFVRSPVFAVFWVAMIFLPFSVAYITRISMDPVWNQGCYGCDINWTDASILMGIFVVGTLVGNFVHCKTISEKDALKITRETQLCWRAGLLTIPAMALYMTDPGQAYANGYYNYLELVFLTPVLILYIQTLHQVYMAQQSRHRLLTSQNINREERYMDVQNDKGLRQRFRAHLDSELSPEIYLFLDAVDKYKANYDKFKDGGRMRQAETIVDTFVDRRGRLEVNLSSRVRERLMAAFNLCAQTENPPQSLFDEAYAEVKEHLLKDGFARFLEKVGPELLLNKGKTNSTRSLATPRTLGQSPKSANNTPKSTRSVGSQRNTPTTTKMVHFAFSDEDLHRSATSNDSAPGAVSPEDV